MKVSIIGATGYGGIELIRLLQHHPYMRVVSVHSSSQAGVPLRDVYPYMEESFILRDIRIDDIEGDLVFLATPPGVSSEWTPKLLAAGYKVIDLSGDFRLRDGNVYAKWYKKQAPNKELLKQAVYGLTEWNRDRIATASLIANPGCYPTATLLGLAPLVIEKWIVPHRVIIDAKSGVSGAGRGVSLGVHFSETNENVKIYKVNTHQHIPEIEQMLCDWNEQMEPVTFSTHLIPMTRGIMATMYAEAARPLSLERIIELYKETYKHCPFVRVREAGSFPCTKDVYGSNYCDIGLAYDERTNRITVVSVIDNLVKGAAGQAVQNANVMCGWDEQTGLTSMPMYP
ncbi:N-acetyl-gamma-glutamyl-phosphate reductase [Anoxybacillus sp.]|uniref:N-acetyl-gamma-glutamyl-phosphate reductase n=1 Tax=Anoxybacillus sp. TaxID=1872573 RepID=UPI00262A955B|nr:N-acetyl-gamma-glutamyl-phosphate reductase [uncultured Anoxybacillus sp.]